MNPKRQVTIVYQIADLVIELLQTLPEPKGTVQVIEAPSPSPGFQPMAVTVKDAAKHLGLSRGTLYRLMTEKQIKWIKIGSRRLIERVELERFITVNRVQPSAATVAQRSTSPRRRTTHR